jgi:alcohol dehydrogenase class IV
VFAGVKAHSPLPDVMAASAELKRLNADVVIAVGGGSAVVTARAAAIILAEGDNIRALCTAKDQNGEFRSPRLSAPKLPQLVIATTPNTATVKAGSAVLDPASGERLALFDPKTRAQSVFVHPQMVASAPRELVVSAALDSFTLAIEGLLSLAGNPVADACLMHSVRMLAAGLPAERLDGHPEERSELVVAALLCGHGTDSTGAGIATVLGHAVGGRYGVENGLVKAVLMPHALLFNAEAARAGLDKIAASIGMRTSSGSPSAAAINDSLSPILAMAGASRLRDLGVPRTELASIAEHAMQDWFLRSNPRPVRSADELVQVLEQSW